MAIKTITSFLHYCKIYNISHHLAHVDEMIWNRSILLISTKWGVPTLLPICRLWQIGTYQRYNISCAPERTKHDNDIYLYKQSRNLRHIRIKNKYIVYFNQPECSKGSYLHKIISQSGRVYYSESKDAISSSLKPEAFKNASLAAMISSFAN